MRILIVEDDSKIAYNISQYFQNKSNFFTEQASTFEEAQYFLETEKYDAVILDLMLPDGNGLDLLKNLRNHENSTPVLVLTAKNQIEDKVTGLENGADDYLAKPFALEELLARIKTIIRRKELITPSPYIKIDKLEIDTNACTVSYDGEQISLAPKEYDLIEYLAYKNGIVISRLELLNHVWGEEIDPFSNTIDVHINYLRNKLEDGQYLLKTVKGKGYMLCGLQRGKNSL